MTTYLRKSGTTSKQRAGALLTVKIKNKKGEVLDPSEAWSLLQSLFEGNLNYELAAAEIRPDLESSIAYE